MSGIVASGDNFGVRDLPAPCPRLRPERHLMTRTSNSMICYSGEGEMMEHINFLILVPPVKNFSDRAMFNSSIFSDKMFKMFRLSTDTNTDYFS